MKKIMQEWADFLDWCKKYQFNPSHDYVLRGYVMSSKKSKEGVS